MKTRYFFIFLLLLVPSTMTFAYPVEITPAELAKNCEYHSENLNETYNTCYVKRFCEGLEFDNKEGAQNVLEEDYLVQLFLQNNLWASSMWIVNINSAYNSGWNWLVGDEKYHENKQFGISLNDCNDITQYHYRDLNLSIYGVGDNGKAFLDIGEKDIFNSPMSAIEGKYEIAKRLMGKQLSPKVQMSEFGIIPNQIHCNDGLELFERNNNVPVCIQHQTFEKLVERGFNLEYFDM